MPTYTHATHWRKRHEAIGKKGEYESSLLFGDEDNSEHISQLHNLKPTYDAKANPSSPISVSSTFDYIPTDSEVKSFALPGAWVVVGKKGRALKNGKMYDEPELAKKKKRKARSRPRKKAEAEPLAVSLEDEGVSSKCLSAHERATATRKKQLARAQLAKHWASYQRAKASKRGALDELAAAMMMMTEEGTAEEDAPVPTVARRTRSKDHKANRLKDKARRRARSAAVSARCFVHDDDEPLHAPEEEEAMMGKQADKQAVGPRKPSNKGELELLFDASGSPLAEVKPPGAWTTVGKRGKALPHFPPLHKAAADKAGVGDKAPTEAAGSTLRKQTSKGAVPKAAGKKGKSSKTTCSVM